MDRNELLKMVVEAREELAKINLILDKCLVALAQTEKPAVNPHPGSLHPIPNFGDVGPYFPTPRWYKLEDIYTGPSLPWNGNIFCDKSYDDNDLQLARSLLGPTFGQSCADDAKYSYNPEYDLGKTSVHSCD